MTLSTLHTVGRSGLPVSPLALGAMTFGSSSWGSPDDVSKGVFNTCIDGGGKFLDTADVYSGGRCEVMIGTFIADSDLRDHVVVATK